MRTAAVVIAAAFAVGAELSRWRMRRQVVRTLQAIQDRLSSQLHQQEADVDEGDSEGS